MLTLKTAAPDILQRILSYLQNYIHHLWAAGDTLFNTRLAQQDCVSLTISKPIGLAPPKLPRFVQTIPNLNLTLQGYFTQFDFPHTLKSLVLNVRNTPQLNLNEAFVSLTQLETLELIYRFNTNSVFDVLLPPNLKRLRVNQTNINSSQIEAWINSLPAQLQTIVFDSSSRQDLKIEKLSLPLTEFRFAACHLLDPNPELSSLLTSFHDPKIPSSLTKLKCVYRKKSDEFLEEVSLTSFLQQVAQNCPHLDELEIESKLSKSSGAYFSIDAKTLSYLPKYLSKLVIQGVAKTHWNQIERHMWPSQLTYLSLVPILGFSCEVYPTLLDLHKCPGSIRCLQVANPKEKSKKRLIEMNQIFAVQNLTQLEISFSSSIQETCCYAFPKYLQALTIKSARFKSTQELTKFVQRLTKKMRPIANSLQTLRIIFSLQDKDEAQFKPLIREMKSLTHLDMIMDVGQTQERSTLFYDLPTSLTKIGIKSRDEHSIRDFCASISPEKTPNLRTLHLSVTIQWIPLPIQTQLPTSLLSLDLESIFINVNQLTCLPPSLTALRTYLPHFDCNNICHLDLLPKGLKILDVISQIGYLVAWKLCEIDVKEFVSHLPPKLAILDAGVELEKILMAL